METTTTVTHTPEPPLYGAVEGGGTKFLCALTDRPPTAEGRPQREEILAFRTIAVAGRGAAPVLAEVIDFFRAHAHLGQPAALGLSMFGPIELRRRPGEPGYGHVLRTPKPGWSNVPVLGPLAAALGLAPARVRWDTDVNGAALAEQAWGAGCAVVPPASHAAGVGSEPGGADETHLREQRHPTRTRVERLDPLLYLTVGTGIGGGAVVDGRPLHGLLHPEMGHIPVPDFSDPFPGLCPFHGRCLEGVASGEALRARLAARREARETAQKAEGGRRKAEGSDGAAPLPSAFRLPPSGPQPPVWPPPDDPLWDLEARYLAYGIATYVLVLSPRRVVIGGGVVEGQKAHLLPRIRREVRRFLAGYVPRPEVERDAGLDDYVVPPQLEDPSDPSGLHSPIAPSGESGEMPRWTPGLCGALLLAYGAGMP